MRTLLHFALLCLMALIPACQLLQEPTGTTVDGTLVNKYTRQPLVGVPIEVQSWRYGSFGNTMVDSVTGTRTDAAGRFHIAFDADAKGVIYRADFRDSRDLYDLTDYRSYDNSSSLDGASLNTGEANQVAFEATPYVPVRVLIDADKQGATLLQAYFSADESTGLGWFAGTIATDTARIVQRVVLDRTISVLPNKLYAFTLYKATVVRIGPYQFRSDNVSFRHFARAIGYTDTVTIHLR